MVRSVSRALRSDKITHSDDRYRKLARHRWASLCSRLAEGRQPLRVYRNRGFTNLRCCESRRWSPLGRLHKRMLSHELS